MASGKFLDTISDIMSEALQILSDWAMRCGWGVNPRKTELVLFTRGTKTTEYKVPQGTRLSLSKSAKYLGVVLDSKLNWLENTAVRLKKTYVALYACQRLVDVNSLFHWLFTAVVRPVATYGCHIWWTITNHQTNIQKINRINRMALIYMTGAMRTTATAALEVLMGVTPLDLHIRRTEEIILMRLKSLDSLGNAVSRHMELVASVGRDIRTDFMATQHVYEGQLRSIIPSIEEWREGRIYFGDLNIRTARRWMKARAVVSTAKIWVSAIHKRWMTNAASLRQRFAIAKAAELLLMRPIFRSDISLFIDSQAAIKALGNPNITSKVVSSCRRELRVLTEQHNITLCWVPVHYGIRGK
ncbi:uncharacterized protein LOC142225075 [Haematobia irritans]|uniref:uncharacterized protein LOC142225075 n=1 Tax=Haematobia irritans TaxID=7368 RepID=UPI003F4F8F13